MLIRRINSIFRTFILVLFVVVAVSNCSWRQPPPLDTLILAIDASPKTLDPRYATDATGQRLGMLIFSGLVTFDNNLAIIGDAAESWVYKNLVYTFTLKPNIRFHNGESLTAEDIRFSVAQYQQGDSPFAAQFSDISKVEARYDDRERWVKIHLKKYGAALLSDLQLLKFLPKKQVETLGEDFFRQPIGSGAYRLVSQDAHNIKMQSFSDYFGQPGRSPYLLFKVIKDGNTRFQKTYQGKVDIVQADMPYAKLRVFEQSPRFQLLTKSGTSMNYILLNLRDELLADKKVRQVLFQSLNRQEIIDYAIEGFAEPATSILTPTNPFFNPNLTVTPLTDAEYQQVLASLRGKTLVLKTNNVTKSVEMGKIIAHQWRQLGIDVKLQSFEWGTFYEDIKKGNFQMATMKWLGAIDPDIYRSTLHSQQTPPGRNRGYYKNLKFDELVDQGIAEENPQLRKQIYFEAQKMIFADLPIIPLWYEKQIAIVHQRVRGYTLPTNGSYLGIIDTYKEANDK